MASGYCEWLPYAYRQTALLLHGTRSPLTFAGLWDEWKDIKTGEPHKSRATQYAFRMMEMLWCLARDDNFRPRPVRNGGGAKIAR